jgi:hypothetical protein
MTLLTSLVILVRWVRARPIAAKMRLHVLLGPCDHLLDSLPTLDGIKHFLTFCFFPRFLIQPGAWSG